MLLVLWLWYLDRWYFGGGEICEVGWIVRMVQVKVVVCVCWFAILEGEAP